MCLVAIAWRAHARYPLIVAGNRDEFHERPSAPAGWWDDAKQVFGGRDLVAGGSWLAVSRSGRFAAVTNNPRRPAGPEPRPSRGHLVRDFVTGDKPSGRFLDAIQVREELYPGFALLVGTRVQVRGFISPRGAHQARWTLPAGISVVSNSPLEAPWPKVGFLEEALRLLLREPQLEWQQVFAALNRREPIGADEGRSPAVGRTPFIVGERYGTRASTVVAIDTQGFCEFEERRFDAAGEKAGIVRERFEMGT
jgi:uncharacterized protein with NRDE domain